MKEKVETQLQYAEKELKKNPNYKKVLSIKGVSLSDMMSTLASGQTALQLANLFEKSDLFKMYAGLPCPTCSERGRESPETSILFDLADLQYMVSEGLPVQFYLDCVMCGGHIYFECIDVENNEWKALSHNFGDHWDPFDHFNEKEMARREALEKLPPDEALEKLTEPFRKSNKRTEKELKVHKR